MVRLLASLALVLTAMSVGPTAVAADKPEINQRGPGGFFSSGEKWDYALNGYDPVAYFDGGAPRKGDPAHKTDYKGATFLFASAEHKTMFEENPERYAPEYGGYCAYAVSQGSTASGDPEVWHIHNGQLYLNLNKDVQGKWLKDKPGYIEQADANWPKVLQ